MSTQLRHESACKLHIKNALYAYLYEPLHKASQHKLEEIIIRNTVLIKGTHRSFVYKGVYYTCEATPGPRKANRLDPRMKGEMDKYLKDLEAVNDLEIPYVVNYINRVLNSSDDLQDYFHLLPDGLHPIVQKFISSCPCRHGHLSETEVEQITKENTKSLELMKIRMTTNLLIG